MLPVLYSFRRCPYAMRARLALHTARISHEIIEVDLKKKPASLLQHSPKGTVPVLVLDTQVIEESLEIMYWALTQHDPEQWLPTPKEHTQHQASLDQLEQHFIPALYPYKYPERYDQQAYTKALEVGQTIFQHLNTRLAASKGLCCDTPKLADYAWLPLLRQWHKVDPYYLSNLGLNSLAAWIETQCRSDRFQAIMTRYDRPPPPPTDN